MLTSYAPYNLVLFNALNPSEDVSNDLVTTTAVNMLVKIPIISVTAKP
jgi:hypothetical protein